MSSQERVSNQSISPQRLKTAVDNHVLWLQTDGRDGRRANLAGENVSGVSLRGLYLAEANFRGAVLAGADFSGANLQGADFSEADLTQTNFRGALLDGANLSRSSARRCYLDEVSAIDANFSGSVMDGVSATGADCSGAKFRDAALAQANFSGALLVQADLRHATASDCRFDGANLAAADCRSANFDRARFQNAILHEAQMREASFEQVLFTEADFSKVLELEPKYQSESFALEKQSIQIEIENIARMRDEVAVFETQIQRQRHEIAQQRRVLASLKDLEEGLSVTLISHMLTARRMAMFWFVAVAVFATVMASRAMELGMAYLNSVEGRAIAVLLLAVLAAHIWSAASSFKAAKQFARYIRLRRDKLSRVHVGDEELAPDQASQRSGEVTYL